MEPFDDRMVCLAIFSNFLIRVGFGCREVYSIWVLIELPDDLIMFELSAGASMPIEIYITLL